MNKSHSDTYTLAFAILRTARPRQWVKNASLYAALFLSGFFFDNDYFLRVTWSFLVFTLITSAIYIFNDIIDAPQDKLHPYKQKRPIPSGQLPVPIALFVSISAFFLGLFLAFTINPFFFTACLAYSLLHYSYTLWLKKIPILDVLAIATGFIIRVYAGALVVNLHMNVWFLLTVVSLSLFLAVGKRQSERTLLTGLSGNLAGHRITLSRYTERLLDIYTGMFANATWLSYAIFSFNYSPVKPQGLLLSLYTIFPRTFNSEKLMMATVPLVIYGVMRYLQLVYEQNKGESPERVLLSDQPLIFSVLAWALIAFTIIYWLG
jgi:4-hydroxybenzoate polyprenyltransferase